MQRRIFIIAAILIVGLQAAYANLALHWDKIHPLHFLFAAQIHSIKLQYPYVEKEASWFQDVKQMGLHMQPGIHSGINSLVTKAAH